MQTNLYQDYEALSGTYGKLYENGRWLAQFHDVETNFEHKYEEIPLAGETTPGEKYNGTTYSGKAVCTQFETEFLERILVLGPDQRPLVTELLVTVEDPAGRGNFKVRLNGVKFKSGDLIKYKHGSPIDQTFEFSFRYPEIVEGIPAAR